MSKEDQGLILSEIYLARRTAIELVRDAGDHVIKRLNNAFLNEIVTILYRNGLDIVEEANRLFESNEEEAARLLIAYVATNGHRTGVPKSTAKSPATPSST